MAGSSITTTVSVEVDPSPEMVVVNNVRYQAEDARQLGLLPAKEDALDIDDVAAASGPVGPRGPAGGGGERSASRAVAPKGK